MKICQAQNLFFHWTEPDFLATDNPIKIKHSVSLMFHLALKYLLPSQSSRNNDWSLNSIMWKYQKSCIIWFTWILFFPSYSLRKEKQDWLHFKCDLKTGRSWCIFSIPSAGNSQTAHRTIITVISYFPHRWPKASYKRTLDTLTLGLSSAVYMCFDLSYSLLLYYLFLTLSFNCSGYTSLLCFVHC